MEQLSDGMAGGVAEVSVVTIVLPILFTSMVFVVAALGWIIRKRCIRRSAREAKDEETQYFAVNNLSYSIMERIEVQPKNFKAPQKLGESLDEITGAKSRRYSGEGSKGQFREKATAAILERSTADKPRIDISSNIEKQIYEHICSTSETTPLMDYSNAIDIIDRRDKRNVISKMYHESYALPQKYTISSNQLGLRSTEGLHPSDHNAPEGKRPYGTASTDPLDNYLPGEELVSTLDLLENNPVLREKADQKLYNEEIVSSYATTVDNHVDPPKSEQIASSVDCERQHDPGIPSAETQPYTIQRSSSPLLKDSLHRKKKSRRVVVPKKILRIVKQSAVDE